MKHKRALIFFVLFLASCTVEHRSKFQPTEYKFKPVKPKKKIRIETTFADHPNLYWYFYINSITR